MQIDKLLTEWLAFAEDVQPSCAAGADQLDFLRASTEAELQKLNVQPQLQQTHVSGALPLNLTIYRNAQSMDYKQFCQWFNQKLGGNDR